MQNTIAPLKFKSCYQIEILEPDKTFLVDEENCRLLRGKLTTLVSSLLKTNAYSRDEIVDILANKASVAEVYYVIELLKQSGHLEEENTLTKERSAFFHFLDVNPKEAEERLKTFSLFALGFGNVDVTPYTSAF